MSGLETKETDNYEDLTEFVYDEEMESVELPVAENQEPEIHAGESIPVTMDERTYEEIEEVTIKFSPKLAEKFEGQDGKTFFEIKMPNLDNEDKSPWWHFVLPEKAVHEDKYSTKERLWAKLPADGSTTMKRSIKTKETLEDGSPVYKEETYSLGNRSLSKMFDPKVREMVNASHDKDIAIRITNKLVGEPFLAKDGKDYIEVTLPNENPDDKRPWAHFVVRPGQVMDDKFKDGFKVVYLPENSTVTLKREIKTDEIGEDGKAVYKSYTEKTTAKAVKERFTLNKESVKDKLNDKQNEVEAKKAEEPEKKHEKSKGMGIE